MESKSLIIKNLGLSGAQSLRSELPESEHRMLGSLYIVDTRDWSGVRSTLYDIGIFAGLFRNFMHDLDKSVKGLLALILGRLYHHGFMEEQREVDSWSMIAIIEQTLGHIHGSNAGRLVLEAVENELVLAQSVYRKLVIVL